jgi:hypothetical protein
MTRLSLRAVACLVLLWSGAALAKITPQQNCDYARITAWKVYVSCVDSAVAKVAMAAPQADYAAFANCRHAYFKKWATWQASPYYTKLYAGSTCIGSRFTDNGDGTVADNLSGLVWEKKTTDASVHDWGNLYTWSTGSPWNGDGTAFSTFLTGLNAVGFAGTNDWRLPMMVELQTIVLDFACTKDTWCSCGSNPCIDGTFGSTQSNYYSSATSHVPGPYGEWGVYFSDGAVGTNYDSSKTKGSYVRAVRGGL